MEVVKNIEKISGGFDCFVDITTKKIEIGVIEDNKRKIIVERYVFYNSPKILEVYESCIKFIKWYYKEYDLILSYR